MKKKFLVLCLVIIPAVLFYFAWLVPRYTVPILMYHSIGYKDGTYFVTPENFAKQMQYIKNKGYQVITLEELVQSIKNKKPAKRNKVVITFDDGCKSSFVYAYPILKKYNFPAIIFLITDFMDKTYMAEDIHLLSWDDALEMFKNGIAFGSHTKKHFYCGEFNDENELISEINESKQMIEAKLSVPADFFCYPSGGFNPRVKAVVAQAGYQGACTTNRGFVKFNQDVYELKRIKVTNSDTNKPLNFWIKLSGYYNLLKRGKNPY